MEKKRGIGLPVRIVMLILNGCFIALLLLSYLCQLLNPHNFPKLSIFSILYPYTLIINILFIIYWAITKNKHAFWSIIAIIIGWSNVGKFVQLKATPLPENTQNMKIMSYNVHVMGVDNHSIHQKDSIISFLAEEQPDIICLQEFYDRKEKNMQQIIGQADIKYFYKSTCVTEGNDTYGLITFSRYPIIDHGDIHFDNSVGNHASYIDINAGDDTLRIYNIHLQSMHFANTDYSFARQATKPSGMTSDEFTRTTGPIRPRPAANVSEAKHTTGVIVPDHPAAESRAAKASASRVAWLMGERDGSRPSTSTFPSSTVTPPFQFLVSTQKTPAGPATTWST